MRMEVKREQLLARVTPLQLTSVSDIFVTLTFFLTKNGNSLRLFGADDTATNSHSRPCERNVPVRPFTLESVSRRYFILAISQNRGSRVFGG